MARSFTGRTSVSNTIRQTHSAESCTDQLKLWETLESRVDLFDQTQVADLMLWA